MELVTYLGFNGTCETAFKVYERVLGGEILMMARYADNPCASGAPPVNGERIMHARLRAGRYLLMGGDTMGDSYAKPQGFCAHIMVDTPEEAERIFADLSEGGSVTMPMAETFWALRFGMLTDRFGVPWMVNCEKKAAMTEETQSAFVISRVFDVQRAKLWDCFAKLEHMKSWWGPKAVDIGQASMDFKVGGAFHYTMRPAAGPPIWGKMLYREIRPQERILCVSSFSDELGGLSRHPMAPQWPIQILVTFSFSDEKGGSKLTVSAVPLHPLHEESVTFDKGHDSLRMGWSGTLDKLAAFLAKR